MPDVVMVIAQEVFRDEEYAEPRTILQSRGARVVTASTAPGKCIGKLGMTAEAELSISEAAERRWDAVVLVGGGGASCFFDDADAHRLAREALASGAVVGAICIAPSVLAHAGLLKGIRATAFPSQEADLTKHGAVWTGEAVTVDGRIVTANGPDAADEFGESLARLLGI
ncbi:MAG TPA: DJ-1/PfpI family protein [Coriobacteriia bacterium]|nr:DJ-1/PfpI family protein [Coriobacteriia bacterium]